MLHGMRETGPAPSLADTLASVGDGVMVADPGGIVLYVNASGEKLIGWTAQEAMGRPFDQVFPLVDYFSGSALRSPIDCALACGGPVGLQNHAALITRAGTPCFVSASCSPIFCQNGGVKGVVVVFRDIDRIKGIEEEVRRERNNLKNVLEALPTGIMLVGGDAVVRWVNRPLLALFEVREDELLGRRFGDGAKCVYSSEKGCGEGGACRFCPIRQNIAAVVREGESRRDRLFEQAFLQGDGECSRWLKASFIPFSPGDDPQIVVAVEDVTEQKQHEAALQRSRDEAESASRVKSEFLANMSHEIRTPLNGLIGMVDLLLQSEMGRAQAAYAGMAKMSADALLKVISDILDFSRIEAGKVDIACVPFDLKAVVDDVVHLHGVLAQQKGLQLQYSFCAGVPRQVRGDPDRLRQILNNLIGNAVKFTDTGRIGVEVRAVGAQDARHAVEFCVSDTGIGIPAGQMDLLFKRFSQVDGSVTRRHSGTGLGLAICKQLAELMGGTVRAESEVGRGSRFYLAMAFVPDSGAPQGALSDAAPAFSPTVVEDGALRRRTGQGADLLQGGGIWFGRAAEPAAGGELSRELEALDRLRQRLEAILRDGQPQWIEETAHGIKQAALRIGADALAELAFKAELASRKQGWADAAGYSAEMIREISLRCRGE
ncbi:MAG: PAS domain-containing protein [Clostridiales bacterium]|nr:PAS domain-containing protein [Clostridiales bacterium]